MKWMRRVLGSPLVSVSLLVVACSPSADSSNAAASAPEAIGAHEDAVCGMLVREQSAPRAQVVHRDGTRLFFCSLGDLLVHLSAPSPHGAARDIFVEKMEPDEDPQRAHTGDHAWIPVADAAFVIGVPRTGIMGEPVLSYGNEVDAQAIASAHEGARSVDLEGLRRWWAEKQARQ